MRFHFRFLSPSSCGLRVDSAGQREERGPRGSLRRRRSACQHGSYTVGGKTCCLCAAGQRLSQPCGDTPEDRVCEYCDPGKTYSSVPNAESTCKPCTSCTRRGSGRGAVMKCPLCRPYITVSQRVMPFPVEKLGCSAVRRHDECPNRSSPSNGEVAPPVENM
ncbi:Tumor necrosis factor receptor superfamily member 16 [Merluccius polli]|uniref:Tumor necrosis factor receptor superfamily member 16 n=1 Tax=Merluccius polli TaxID=89951 RepID=A0AA47N6U3_MERPO|nr:Tumor necrosis factor receptor superfamily member 16 [Merluccius polli]